jgi:hypothetical protein
MARNGALENRDRDSRAAGARAAGDGAEANPKTAPDPGGNTEKDPKDWVSGGEPMTGAQASYLKTLSEETGAEAYRPDLTKAEASTAIDELKTARDQTR